MSRVRSLTVSYTQYLTILLCRSTLAWPDWAAIFYRALILQAISAISCVPLRVWSHHTCICTILPLAIVSVHGWRCSERRQIVIASA